MLLLCQLVQPPHSLMIVELSNTSISMIREEILLFVHIIKGTDKCLGSL